MRSVVVGVAVALLAAGAAAAQVNLTISAPRYSYFNRAGADLATHDAELIGCLIAADMAQGFERMVGADINLMLRFQARDNFAANLENCMVARKWRVVTVDDAVGAKLLALSSAEVARSFLSDRVGEDPPRDAVFRRWNNDAGRPETIRGDLGLNNNAKPSLSVKGLDPERVKQAMQNARPTTNPKAPPGFARVNDSAKALAKLPADSALIVLRLKNISASNGYGLTFERVGADPATPAWMQDGQPSVFAVSQGTLGAKPEGRVFVGAVPPGVWRLKSLLVGQVLTFCLGAPSFAVGPGDVVFAGTFDMAAGPLSPAMDMETANRALAARPDFAQRATPADYVNGSTGVCDVGLITALEFPNTAKSALTKP